MSRVDQRPAQAWLVGSCFLVACNAVLGIKAPKDGELTDLDEHTANGAAGAPGTEPDGEQIPVFSEEAPSPYAWASWPMPNPSGAGGVSNPQNFGVRSSGVILDNLTKLEWQRAADMKERTRDEAEDYCSNLRLGGGGFRLPSRIELLSIVDFTKPNPSLDENAFPDAAAGRYWTGSRHASGSERGWVINFEFGTSFTLVEAANEPLLVRCVRPSGGE